MSSNEQFEQALNLIKLKEYEKAEKIVIKLIEKNPDKEVLYLTLGNIYLFLNKQDKALEVYNKASEISPEDPDIYSNIGLVYKQMGKNQEAIEFIDKALALDKNRADIYYNLGNVYKQIGDDRKTETFLEKTIELDPGFVQAYNNLGTLYIEQEKPEKAEDIILKGLAIDENHPRLLYNLGIIRDQQGKSKEAIDLYKRSLVNQPLWVDSLNNLGIAYHKSNLPAKALKTFNNALGIDPDNPMVKNNMAVTYKSVGEEKKAKQYYKEAISHNPEYLKASLNLSSLYRETGDFDNAIKELNRIQTINPDDNEIKIHKAYIYFDQGKYDSAEEIIHSVKEKKKEENPAALALKAMIKIKTGNPEEAAALINKAGKIDKVTPSLNIAKAELFRQQKKLPQAEEILRKLISDNEGDFKISLALARVLKDQEKFDEALRILDDLRGSYRHNRDTIAEYSDIYRKSGQDEKALEYSNKLLSSLGKEDSHFDFDSLNKGIELFDEASKSYAKLNNHIMEERLDDFVKEYVNNEQEKVVPQDSMSFIIGSLDGLNSEEVPIIDIGGLEPVIEINEEEESHELLEEEFDPYAEDGLYEETTEKIRKEIVEEMKKDSSPMQLPGQPQSGQPQPMQPQGQPLFTPPAPAAASEPRKPFVKVPRPVYDNLYDRQPRTPASPFKMPDKADKNLVDKLSGIEEPEGQAFSDLKNEPEYINPEISHLLEQLENMTDYLNPDRRDKYDKSVMKLKVNALKLKLNGNKGLLNSVSEKDPEAAPVQKVHYEMPLPPKVKEECDIEEKEDSEITGKKIEETFLYIKGLINYLPEDIGGETVKLKIDNLLGKIEEEKV